MSQAQLDEYRDSNTDHDWWDCLYEGFKEDMTEKGIAVDDISFSGFWSQGDGASFTGYIADLEKYLAAYENEGAYPTLRKLQAMGGNVALRWYRAGHHYVHEYTLEMDASVESFHICWWADPEMDPLRAAVLEVLDEEANRELTKLEASVKENIRNLCRGLYRQLEEEYDYLTSDEAVKESLVANDIWEDEEDNNGTSETE